MMATYLFRMYQKTHLNDYLFLGSTYFSFALNIPIFFIRHSSEPSTILWMLNMTFYNSIFFFALLHLMLIRNDKLSKPLLTMFGGWFAFSSLSSIFVRIQVIPTKARILGIPIYIQSNIAGSRGLTLKIGDKYVFGDGMQLLNEYFRISVLLYGIFTYINVKPALNNSVTRNAKRIWIFSIIIWFISPVGQLMSYHFNYEKFATPAFQGLEGIASLLLLGFIIIRYPYSLILTKEQLLRASDLYKFVVSAKNQIKV